MSRDGTETLPARAAAGDPLAPCANCGEPRPGQYCPSCGQRQGDRVASLRRLLADALEDQFSLNSALPRTLRALITRPGFLTTEYIAGRIARYVPPFRLYLAASILFFVVLSLVSIVRPPERVFELETTDGGPVVTGDRPNVVRVDDGSFFGIRVDSTAVPDTTVIFVNLGPRWLSRLAVARVEELSRLPPGEIARVAIGVLRERAPAGMFVLLPVFAAFLKLAMVGKQRYYVEHFVFALHTHAFMFLALTPAVVIGSDWADIALIGALLVYFFVAMRRFYGLGIAGTLVRGAFLLFAYQALLILVLLGITAVGLVLG